MITNRISQDVESVQRAVSGLGVAVKKSGVNWRDKQYASLSQAISNVAKDSKRFLQSGDKCARAIEQFQQIENGN